MHCPVPAEGLNSGGKAEAEHLMEDEGWNGLSSAEGLKLREKMEGKRTEAGLSQPIDRVAAVVVCSACVMR